jgi:NADH-quinone oxidoreductase subunit A
MTDLTASLVVFTLVGAGFILANLTLGRLLRPHRPDPEKDAVYECGEPAVGPAWVQFDLRYYVVALLFVVFDVEVAFVVPWAVVFGTLAKAADADPAAATQAWLVFAEFAAFFGMLLVGFAFLWRRGDLDWVRSLHGQDRDPAGKEP